MLQTAQSSEHRRSVCDNLLVDDSEGMQFLSDSDSTTTSNANPEPPRRRRLSAAKRAFLMRMLALFCACWLSVGSHYAGYVLGPLKTSISHRLKTGHAEFGLLLSALSLNSTWTPIVGGLMAATLGTTLTSILATGTVFVGTVFLLVGDIWGDVRVMMLGLFLFGLGVSPVAVCQETIIVRFFKSHGLGVSMAFGLVVGKGASFVSARTSYPLTQKFGSRAPFYVAVFLAFMSVVMNLLYILGSRWLIDGAGAELEAVDIHEEAQRRSLINISEAQALEKVAAKRRVRLKDVEKLGDTFFAYIAMNLLCGCIWAPFTHLAANIIELRFHLSQEDAANTASYVLVGSIFLYPLCGFIVDRFRRKPIVVWLLLFSSLMTLGAYIWLALPPTMTGTARPAIGAFGLGHGFAPLLLVLLVPKIVPMRYISTALGAHKSLEQTGSTLFQTLAGLGMDRSKRKNPEGSSTQGIINAFLLLNLLQLLSIFGVAYFQRRREVKARREQAPRVPLPADATQPLLQSVDARRYSTTSQILANSEISEKEKSRGRVFASICGGLVLSAWITFLAVAWMKLGRK